MFGSGIDPIGVSGTDTPDAPCDTPLTIIPTSLQVYKSQLVLLHSSTALPITGHLHTNQGAKNRVLPELQRGHLVRSPNLCWPANSAQRLWEWAPCKWSLGPLLDQPARHASALGT